MNAKDTCACGAPKLVRSPRCRACWRNNHYNPAYDAKRPPTELEVAWAAGLYEGEGSCHKPSTPGASLRINIDQQDTEILHRLTEYFGGNIAERTRKQTTLPDGRYFDSARCSVWYISGRRAEFFIAKVWPYMSQRRRAQILQWTKEPAA